MQSKYERSQLVMRAAIGLLGVALPFMLMLIAALREVLEAVDGSDRNVEAHAAPLQTVEVRRSA